MEEFDRFIVGIDLSQVYNFLYCFNTAFTVMFAWVFNMDVNFVPFIFFCDKLL